MKNILSSLNESEKNRILEMHKSATRNNYLSEQNDPTTPTAATAPGPKDPSAFVKSVTEIKINKDQFAKLIFKSPTYTDGITFTTKVTKSSDYKDPSTGKMVSNPNYVIMLESPAMNIRFDYNCASGGRFTQAIIKDQKVVVTNPMENNKSYTGDQIPVLLKQLNSESITKANPFLVEFKQQHCS
jgi:hypothetical protein